MTRRTFLLSPANCSGKRAYYLLREQADFALAVRLRNQGATIGEIYTFMSGLYFRGKLAYSAAFGDAYVIAPGLGLVPPDLHLSLADVKAIAAVAVDPDDPSFANPLRRDATLLAGRLGKDADVVLLGSIATPKYLEPLRAVLGDRLLLPREFIGRGDMSRGALMLRAVADGRELEYVRGIQPLSSRGGSSLPAKRRVRQA